MYKQQFYEVKSGRWVFQHETVLPSFFKRETRGLRRKQSVLTMLDLSMSFRLNVSPNYTIVDKTKHKFYTGAEMATLLRHP